jgi:hypothetical protein
MTSVEASIHKIIVEATSGRQDIDLNIKERWTYLIDQSEQKIELGTASIDAAKM